MERVKNYIFRRVQTCRRVVNSYGQVSPTNYISNRVDNTKFNFCKCRLTAVTFLPIFLYNEYKNFSNLYFLLLAITQLFPILRVGFLITYFGPIAIILGLSLMKELWDHYKTIQKDSECNNEKFTRLTSSGEEMIRSKDIRVGDFLKLHKNERIPVRTTNSRPT